MYMKKTAARTKRKTTKRATSKRSVASTETMILSTKGGGFWGKDQQMIVLLSCGIIVLIVAGMYLAGWI